MTRGRLLSLPDDFLNLFAHLLEVDAQRLKCLGRHSLALVNESKQDVLGANVVVIE